MTAELKLHERAIHVLQSQFSITYLILVSQTDITKNCYIMINPALYLAFLGIHDISIQVFFTLDWRSAMTGLLCNCGVQLIGILILQETTLPDGKPNVKTFRIPTFSQPSIYHEVGQ